MFVPSAVRDTDRHELQAAILARVFADIRIQRFAGVHHFVPPEDIYTPAHAQALEALWARASAPQLAFQK